MGLKDALSGAAPRGPGGTCTFAILLGPGSPLDRDDRDALETALADPLVRTADIARAMCSDGWQITQPSVARHRRRDCRCDP